MNGHTGNWWLSDLSTSGLALMSYFYDAFEQQVLIYVSGPVNASEPRWAHAVSITSALPTSHVCDGKGYAISASPATTLSQLCLMEVKGYAPDGIDAPAGGWNPNTSAGQIWRGTLARSYSSQASGQLEVTNWNPAQTLQATGISVTGQQGLFVTPFQLTKRISVHDIRVEQLTSANVNPVPIANGHCSVQANGEAAGLCDLRLKWITNNFISAAVYMHRMNGGIETGERILVRDTTPITPVDGYPYPPRAGALASQPYGGIAAGDSYKFELYSDRARTELLAYTPTITGMAPGVCVGNPPPTSDAMLISPINNGATSAVRPLFRFSVGANGRYRLKLYASPVGGTESLIGEINGVAAPSGSVEVTLPPHLSQILSNPSIRYRWTVQTISLCGVRPPVSAYFVLGEIDIPDAVPPTEPTPTSDESPLVGSIPVSAGVSGGSATVSVPIEVPPGRHGMQPSVSLGYDSRSGNGIAGMGWSLSGTSSIHRCPKTTEQDGAGEAIDFSDRDPLCLDGQRLVAVGGTTYGANGAIYHTEIESYARIEQTGALTSDGSVSFVVKLKSGEIQYFGNTADSRTVVAVVTPNSTLTPTYLPHVLSWQLHQRRDRSDNTVTYHYQSFGSGEVLLQKIQYTGSATDGSTATGDRWVVMSYVYRPVGSGESDRSSSYIAGARVDQTKRLSAIETRVGSTVYTSASLVRSYTLNFGTASQYSGRALLRDLTVCAFDSNGQNQRCLPKSVFQWQENPPVRRFGLAQGWTDFASLSMPAVVNSGATPTQLPNGVAPLYSDVLNAIHTSNAINSTNDDPPAAPALAGLESIGDLDGDGVGDMLATISTSQIDPDTHLPLMDRYLVQVGADRAPKSWFKIPDTWEYTRPVWGNSIDLDNDGRAEFWTVDSVVRAPTLPAGQYPPAGYYPIKAKLKLLRYATSGPWGTPGAFEDALDHTDENSNANLALWIGTGRLEVTDISGSSPRTQNSARRLVFFADVNGDSKPDLVVQRAPWGTDDPLHDPLTGNYAAACSLDGRGLKGDMLLVHLNITPPPPATGTFTRPKVRFTAVPSPIYSQCVESATPTSNVIRRIYEGALALDDLDGNGVPDLRMQGATTGKQRVQFGHRSTTGGSIWNPSQRVEQADFGANFEDNWEDQGTWLDANGDGLNDYYYRAECKLARDIFYAEDFLRLNTGRGGKGTLLGPRINLSPTHGSDCQRLPPIHRPSFSVPADIDNDGRQELLVPMDFAARRCILLDTTLYGGGSNRAESASGALGNPPGLEKAWFCPEHPVLERGSTSLQIGVLPNTLEVEGLELPVFRMYLTGNGGWDTSAYRMGTRRFVETTAGTANPATGQLAQTFRLETIGPNGTGIVMRAFGGNLPIQDLYGDGLQDWAMSMGCPFFANAAPGQGVICTSLDKNSVVNLPASCSNASAEIPCDAYGPSQMPDGSATDASGIFITESLGAAADAGVTIPVLPELLSTVSNETYQTQSEFTRAHWLYANLSNAAGRTAGDLPLYSIPARTAASQGYVDQDHFYFSSSMPVVDIFTDSTGGSLDGHMMRYGYQEAMYHNKGRGFRGFRKVVVEDLTSGLRTTTLFNQKFPLVGLVEQEAVSLVTDPEDLSGAITNWNPISLSAQSWGCSDGNCPVAPGLTYEVKMTFSWETKREPSTRDLISINEAYIEFDNLRLGNVIRKLLISYDLLPGEPYPGIARSAEVRNTYEVADTGTGWWLDKLVATTSTESIEYMSELLGTDAAGISPNYSSGRTTLFGWDNASRQIGCQAVFKSTIDAPLPTCSAANSATNWESTTSTAYGAGGYGNATSVSVTARRIPTPEEPATTETRSVTTGYGDSGFPSNNGYFPTLVTNAKNQSTAATYDRRNGNVVSATDAKGLKTTSTYDVLGRQVKSIAPATPMGDKTMAPTQAMARKWCSGSDCQRAPGAIYREITEQAGTPTTTQYFDRVGHAIRTERTGFALTINTTATYNDLGQLIEETAPNYGSSVGVATTYLYDQLGRMASKVQRRSDLSPLGAPPATTPASRVTTDYTYVGLRTDIRVTPCKIWGAKTCATPATEPTLNMSRIHGSDGKLLRTDDAIGGVTRYWYDSMGNAVAIQDAKNVLTRASYDMLGRRTQSIDPNRGTWNFSYNGLGELGTQTDARGITLNYQRDELGRLVKRFWRDNDPYQSTLSRCMEDTWTYDFPAPGLLSSESRQRVTSLPTGGPTCTIGVGQAEQYLRTYAYNPSVSDPKGDAFYRPVGVTTAITVGTQTKSFSMQQRYDGHYGRVKQRIYPGGLGVYTEYNERGDAVEEGFAEDFWGYNNANNNYLQRIQSLNAFDQPVKVLYAKGLQQRLSRYDTVSGTLLEVCAQTDGTNCDQLTGGGSNQLSNKPMDIGYRYDLYGNVVEQRHFGRRSTTAGNSHSRPIIENYAYDSLHRLLQSNRFDDPRDPIPNTKPVFMGYDALGNLLKKSDFSLNINGSYVYGNAAHPHAVSRVVRTDNPSTGYIDYSYDANGNVVQRQVAEDAFRNSTYPNLFIGYDADNLPLEIRTGAVVTDSKGFTFRYGPDQQRYFERNYVISSLVKQRFYVDKAYELDTDEVGQANEERYYIGQNVMYVRDSRAGGTRTGVYYNHTDRLGSSIVSTQVANGIIVTSSDSHNEEEHRLYDAYGQPRNDWGIPKTRLDNRNPRGFTQHEHLDSLDLVGGTYIAQTTGLIHMNGREFDSLLGRFLSVDPFIQFPSNSQSLNPYSYVLNNPLAGSDPSGYIGDACPKGTSSSECRFNLASGGGYTSTLSLYQYTRSGGNGHSGGQSPVGAADVGRGIAGVLGSALVNVANTVGSIVWSMTYVPDPNGGPGSYAPTAEELAQVDLDYRRHLDDRQHFDKLYDQWQERDSFRALLYFGGPALGGAVCGVGALACLAYGNGHGYHQLYSKNYGLAGVSFFLTALGGVASEFAALNAEVGTIRASSAEMAEAINAARGTAPLTGQIHHAISRTIHKALEAHPNLRGLYSARDPRFVTQAKDLASHRGYDTFHRNLDAGVAGWVRANPNATQTQFEGYLRGVYQRPDVLARFPNGL